MRFEVTVSYCLWHTETFEVEVAPDELDEFRECPEEFADVADKHSEDTGDVLDGTYEVVINELGVLDQIVDALEVADDAE